jgi:hypothetical protein
MKKVIFKFLSNTRRRNKKDSAIDGRSVVRMEEMISNSATTKKPIMRREFLDTSPKVKEVFVLGFC